MTDPKKHRDDKTVTSDRPEQDQAQRGPAPDDSPENDPEPCDPETTDDQAGDPDCPDGYADRQPKSKRPDRNQ